MPKETFQANDKNWQESQQLKHYIRSSLNDLSKSDLKRVKLFINGLNKS